MFANTRRIEKPPKYLQSCSYYVHCGSWWEMNLQKNAGGQNTFFKLAQVLKKQTSEPRWTKNRRPTWRTFLTYCLETLSLSLSLSPTLDKIHYIFGTCARFKRFSRSSASMCLTGSWYMTEMRVPQSLSCITFSECVHPQSSRSSCLTQSLRISRRFLKI